MKGRNKIVEERAAGVLRRLEKGNQSGSLVPATASDGWWGAGGEQSGASVETRKATAILAFRGSFGYLQMRRLGSYGGPSGVAGSERLKQRLLSTPGLYLLSSSSFGVAGSLAAVGDTQDERVIHRTFGATRNFYAIVSNLKQAKRNSSVNWKDPFAPLVKETSRIDEPVYTDQHCNGGEPLVLVEEVDGNLSSKQGLIERGAREGGVEGIPDVPFSDSQVIDEVELEESIQISSSSDDHLSDASTSASFDTGNNRHQGNLMMTPEVASKSLHCPVDLSWDEARPQWSLVGATIHRKESYTVEDLSTADTSPFGLSFNQECESSLLEAYLVAGELQGAGAHLETERISVALAEADCCVSTLPTSDGQDSRTSRAEKFEESAGKVVIRSNEISHILGTGGGLQDSENKLSKEMAAVEIQSCWRGWQERKHFQLVKDREVSRQSLVRWNQELNPYHRISQAAVVVQKYWRAFQSVKALKRLPTEKGLREQRKISNAAVVVQKHWRFAQSRRVFDKLREERGVRAQQRNYHAAAVLQKHWRAHRGRSLVKHLKVEAREQQRIGAAAVLLQKHWRAWRGRFLVKHLKMEQAVKEKQRISAAIVLQKIWRAQQDRYSMKYLRMEQVGKEKQMINDAALVLQKQWRAHQGRSYLKHLNLEQVAREQQRIDHVAVVIQKHWRAQQGRSFVEQLRMEQVAKLNDAALVLQKHWRAQQGSCLLKLEQIVREKQRMDGYTVVQKHWRAHQRRVLAEHMRKKQLVRRRKMDHAALVLQKYWRGRQSRLVKELKKKQLVNNAVTVVQKWWRAQQGRLKMKRLKLELAARERLRASAATTVQKHWRARQSMLLVKHMQMEEAVREQQTLDNAAIMFQKHWRGQHSRLFVKHLKRETVLREVKRVSAAIVLQKYWRSFQSRQAVTFLYTEQAGKERADELGRNSATRVKFEAALTIQKAWQLYWSSRLTLSAVSIQHPLSSSSNQKRTIEAVRVLQAYARAFVDRRRLGHAPKSADASLQRDRTEIERYTETGMAVVTYPDVMLTGSSLRASDVTGYFSRAKDSVESSPSSSIVHHADAGVGSLDENSSSSDRWQELECAPITSQKGDLSARLGLDDKFAASSVEEAQVQKNGVQECWSYVAVDQLEDCLDTCLAALRPLPSESQYCLPGLDVPDKSQFIGTDQHLENNKNVYIGKVGNKSSHPIKCPSYPSRIQSDYVTSQATLTGAKDHLETTFRPVQETVTQKMENPTQGKSLGRQTAKQNEQRLKQFAQVFLLQRHISLQQQRAQAAPPFPPPMPSGSEIPSYMVTQPFENGRGDQGEAVQVISIHTDSLVSQVEGRRPDEHHVVCEIVGPDDEQLETKGSQACQNSHPKQIIERPGPDVVLDTDLLLRRIKEGYRTSEGDLEGESSTRCTSGCGDVEEGIPLLDRNSCPMRKQIPVAKYSNAVNVKHISIPDVNAVLLVFIAMVVYTRIVCKGLFFGARQSHRRS